MPKLLVPLITPYVDKHYDQRSMQRLIASVEASADMLIPCLSSGEGGKLFGDDWERVVRSVVTLTKKPVFAGILRKEDCVEEYIARAATLGCKGVVLPLGSFTREHIHSIIQECARLGVEIILYNSENALVKDVEYIAHLASNKNVVGLKDSSMDAKFLSVLKEAVLTHTHFEIYQGMEMSISAEEQVDGYCLALANMEPQFCTQLKARTPIDQPMLAQYIEKYNLESDHWYTALKDALHTAGRLQSSETLPSYEHLY